MVARACSVEVHCRFQFQSRNLPIKNFLKREDARKTMQDRALTGDGRWSYIVIRRVGVALVRSQDSEFLFACLYSFALALILLFRCPPLPVDELALSTTPQPRHIGLRIE